MDNQFYDILITIMLNVLVYVSKGKLKKEDIDIIQDTVSTITNDKEEDKDYEEYEPEDEATDVVYEDIDLDAITTTLANIITLMSEIKDLDNDHFIEIRDKVTIIETNVGRLDERLKNIEVILYNKKQSILKQRIEKSGH